MVHQENPTFALDCSGGRMAGNNRATQYLAQTTRGA
jgi:hypothetical protein